jgi:type IV pilus assembly protein PilP
MRRLHLAALVASVVFAAACGEQKKPPPRPAPRPALPITAPATADVGADAPAREWVYTSSGKRDPFRSFLAELDSDGRVAATKCATPLGRFELDQLRLVAVVTGLDDPVAMVEAPNGVGYSLRRGACIGRNGGVIAAVRTGEVLISEWAIRADGSRDKSQTVLRLPKEASLNLEE